MDLEELRRIREQERSADSLQSLRDEFYEEVGDFLKTLKRRRDAAAADVENPLDDPEVRELSHELSTAQRTVESLYERRVGKIVRLASFEAADMSAEHDGLTTEEYELFETIVSAIQNNRAEVLDVIEPDTPASEPPAPDIRGEATSPQSDSESKNSPDPPSEEEHSQVHESDAPDRGNNEMDRRTVRITEDVGEIVGVDERAYDLSTDDIVTLPRQNAEPLLARDAAELIE